MLSLKQYTVGPNAVTPGDFSGVVLRHFPDPHDRTPNDPLYFIPSDQVVKFANRLMIYFELDEVPACSSLNGRHLLVLRDYALSVGWSNVYLAGRQVVLEADFGRTPVDMSGLWVDEVGTSRISLDLNVPHPRDMIRHIPTTVPGYGDPRSIFYITGMAYVCHEEGFLIGKTPIPFLRSCEKSNTMRYAELESPNIKFELDVETGTFHHEYLSARNANDSNVDAPDIHQFDLSYIVRRPAN